MMTLIKNAHLFAPQDCGLKDILCGGGKILAVKSPGEIKVGGLEIDVYEASGRSVLPGFVDPHVHIIGGGGEGGPATRAPEISIEDIIQAGVTTVIGCLGTDGITRHMTSLLAKARALEIEGITTYIFSGSYDMPVRTLTGSVRSDLVLIDKVIGAGEIAISDHRSSQPTFEEIARLAAECRVGGLLGGKAGVLHLHLGDGRRKLDYLFLLIKETEIPPKQVIPTHINRNRDLFDEGLKWVEAGGFIDVTVGEDPDPRTDPDVSLEDCIAMFKAKGLPLSNLMVSSDANGSLPVFNEKGDLIGLTVARQKNLLRKFQDVVRKKILLLEQAASLFSTNAASFYRLDGKGRIEEGAAADLIVLDNNLELVAVFARGKKSVDGGVLLVRSTFA